MKKFIEKLQNKPESVKRLMLWVGVSFFMAVIFGIWILTWPLSFSSPEETAGIQNPEKKLPGMWQTFKDQSSILQSLWQK